MMKSIALAAALAAALPLYAAAQEQTAAQVTVLGRVWTVAPVAETSGSYVAVRHNTELLPFRPPAVPKVRQAMRAFRAATGCTAHYPTMVKSISGAYYARLICPR
ncbi:hypothetical protein ACUXV3_18050 [Roseobacteraceae bacterium NS-SX3]